MLPIARISISRFMSIEELSFEPGAVTVISGKNGMGKSSVVNAILAAFNGCRGELVREGEKEARVVIELSNGTVIDRRISREGKSKPPRVKPPDAPLESAPQRWLDDQVDELINPLEFLTAAPEKRVRWLLEAVPVTVTVDELREACKATLPDTYLTSISNQHGIFAIEDAYQRVYDARREANVSAKSKREAAKQLAASLPPADEEDSDWAATEEAISRELGAAEERERAEVAESEAKAQRELRDIGRDVQMRRDKINDERRAAIEAIEADAREKIATLEAERNASMAKIKDGLGETSALIWARAAEARAGLAEALGSARAKRQEAERSANTRAIMARQEDDAGAWEQLWAEYDAAINGLNKLQTNLQARMPIRDLQVRGGRMYRLGIPFESLNTAACIDIAIEVAELRAGKIGLVAVDGLERLDSEAQELLYKRALGTGLHFIFTKVSDEDALQINQYQGEK